MPPNLYMCDACGERFEFAFRDAAYYVGPIVGPLSAQVADADLLTVPVRPAWCKDCGVVSVVEDIAPLRAFEDAYGAVRAGRQVEYPIPSAWLEPEEMQDEFASYLRWRMSRRHVARALCCGRSNYQFLDVAQPLLKHQECDFGFITPRTWLGGHNGPGPGVRAPANIRTYDAEGHLVGVMTWLDRASSTWTIEPAAYPLVEER